MVPTVAFPFSYIQAYIFNKLPLCIMVNVIVIEKCPINFMLDPMTYVAHKLCKKQKRKSAQKGIQVVNSYIHLFTNFGIFRIPIY